MDAPNGKVDSFLAKREVPRPHVLIDAVDERSVQVEEEGDRGGHDLGGIGELRFGSRPLRPRVSALAHSSALNLC
jgi:hypothetical protein